MTLDENIKRLREEKKAFNYDEEIKELDAQIEALDIKMKGHRNKAISYLIIGSVLFVGGLIGLIQYYGGF